MYGYSSGFHTGLSVDPCRCNCTIIRSLFSPNLSIANARLVFGGIGLLLQADIAVVRVNYVALLTVTEVARGLLHALLDVVLGDR